MKRIFKLTVCCWYYKISSWEKPWQPAVAVFLPCGRGISGQESKGACVRRGTQGWAGAPWAHPSGSTSLWCFLGIVLVPDMQRSSGFPLFYLSDCPSNPSPQWGVAPASWEEGRPLKSGVEPGGEGCPVSPALSLQWISLPVLCSYFGVITQAQPLLKEMSFCRQVKMYVNILEY